jgi:tripartite-type tricarboxylate transporter receptor subunit TctC
MSHSPHPARRLLLVALAIAPALAATGASAADKYPTKPITLIVPGPPGGGTDLLARQLAEAVRPILGVRVVVENKPGAGGALGVTVITQARPDGYTLGFVHNGPLTTIPNTRVVAYTPASYQTLVQVGYSSYLMCVAPSFPANNAREFLDILKNNPGKYTYGTDGVGGTMQLAAEQIFGHFGIKATAIPFGGAGETARNFLGGHIDIYGGSFQAIQPDMAAHKAKCLLLTSGPDNKAAPQASGVDALGLPDASAGLFWGLIGQKDLPAPIANTLVDAFTSAAHTAPVQAALASIHAEPVVRGPQEFRKLIDKESAAFAVVAAHLGMTPGSEEKKP